MEEATRGAAEPRSVDAGRGTSWWSEAWALFTKNAGMWILFAGFKDEVLALALNRDEVEATHPELFNAVLARNRAWAKRMNIDLSKLRP